MGDAVALRTAEQPRLSGRALRFLTDEKLAAMVAAGNDDAFAVLYGRHHQAVYRYCLSVLRQEADARDALQSSMLAALSSLRARPIEGAFKPWLFRIAHNESISIIRGRTREAPTEAPSTAAFTDDPEAREQLRTLVSDLAALPDRQRGAIVMRELSGLSYAQIAAALGTSEAGGKQLVYEARSALHELRDGHEMSCDLVRERISADDRRLLRGRKVRSHLRGCQPCQDFEQGIRRRRTAFAALAPPLAPLAAAAVLQDVFAGAGATGGAGGVASAAGAATAGSSGASLAGSTGLKVLATALLTTGAGIGAYQAGSAILADSPEPVAAAVERPDAWAGLGSAPDARAHATDAERGRSGSAADGRARSQDGSVKAHAGGRDEVAGGGSQAGEPTPSAAVGGPGDSAGPTGPVGGGDGGSGGPPTPAPPVPPDPAPPPGGGVTPGTPPGHGGTAPGQAGGVPPGQVGGETPPGHLGNPGKGGGKP